MIENIAVISVEKGFITDEQRNTALAEISYRTDLAQAVKTADLIKR